MVNALNGNCRIKFCAMQPAIGCRGCCQAWRSANATASSVQPLVTLPSFTALVKREGHAVVNISITWKVSVDTFAFPGFPGIQPDDPFLIFFALRC
jgi:hypothetical protein